MFQNISLWTCDGKLVADVSIPKFNPPAEVLTWGSRTFIRNAAGEYREGMNFVVPIELSSVPFSQKYCSAPSVAITDAKRSTPDAEAPAIAQNASETKRVDVFDAGVIPRVLCSTCGDTGKLGETICPDRVDEFFRLMYSGLDVRQACNAMKTHRVQESACFRCGASLTPLQHDFHKCDDAIGRSA